MKSAALVGWILPSTEPDPGGGGRTFDPDIDDKAGRILDAYADRYPHLTEDLAYEIVHAAALLHTNPFDLANLIRAESRFNPRAQAGHQPRDPFDPQAATGLLQFTPTRAAEMDTTTRALRNMSTLDQMAYVIVYLDQFQPLDTQQRLFMAVFYTDAQDWPPHQSFPTWVTEANPGIHTPSDYIRFVQRHARLTSDGELVSPEA